MKLHKRLSSLVVVSMLMANVSSVRGAIIDDRRRSPAEVSDARTTGSAISTRTTGSAISTRTIGVMDLPEIDPTTNPAEDNWLSREIARQIFGNGNRYTELTQDDFNIVRDVTMMGEDLTELPEQIGNLTNLEGLNLNLNQLSSLPKSIGNLTNLTNLYLDNNQFNDFPESIVNLRNLEELNLKSNQLSSLPESMGNLRNLTILGLSSNQLSSLPESIVNLRNLEELNLSSNQLSNLPESIINLMNLIRLDLSSNQLSSLPESIGNLTHLTTLYLDDNQLSSFPENIDNLINLEEIGISGNRIRSLPESIGNLVKLSRIYSSGNQLRSLPESIVSLTNLQLISVSSNQLSSLSESIGNLTNLTTLDLASNQLNAIPESIGNLTNLTTLYLDDNQLRSLPENIDNLINLEEIGISGNRIRSLPESIGNLVKLSRIYSSGNQLRSLPESIVSLTNLQLISVSSNQLSSLPESIGNLTNLTTLDLASNQLNAIPESIGSLTNLTNVTLENQTVILPEVSTATEYVIINNPIIALGEVVVPTSEGHITYNSVDSTIKFNDLGNTMFEFNKDLIINSRTYTFSGTVSQPIGIGVEPKPVRNQEPVINAGNKEIVTGTVFNPLAGVSATDPEEGELTLTEANVVRNEVDIDIPGSYEVEYRVTDSQGATAAKIIQVKVNIEISDIRTTGSALSASRIGVMNLPAIDPIINPAEDSWLSKEIARQIFGDENRYIELTQDDFDVVREIAMVKKNLTELPESIGNLTNLANLNLGGNQLRSLPESIGNLTNLVNIDLSFNELRSFPESIGNLTNLTNLTLISNQLRSLPENVGNLTNLTMLNLGANELSSLPESINNLANLESLELRFNQLSSISESLDNLTNLTNLDVSSNQLSSIPEHIGNLTKLRSLDLGRNQLSSIPESMGNLTNLTMLYLGGNELSSIPESINNLINLEILELRFNQLRSIPESIDNLTNLTNLDVSSNKLSSVPESIGNLMNLISLDLGMNQLSSIPESIESLTNLTKLLLDSNRLSSVSESIGNLKKLEEMSVDYQTVILSEVSAETKYVTINNPIIVLGDMVVPNSAGNIIYNSLDNTITFNNLGNTMFEFSKDFNINGNRYTFSGTITQPIRFNVSPELIDTNQIPTVSMHTTEFFVGEEVKPSQYVVVKDDGDLSKVVIKVTSTVPYEVKNGKEYFKTAGKFTFTYSATDELGANSTYTFDIVVKNKVESNNQYEKTSNHEGSSISSRTDNETNVDRPLGIGLLKYIKYVEAYEDGIFKEDISITRGELVTMLARILFDGQKMPTVSMQFKDVSDTYFTKDTINYFAKLGIVEGYEDGTFKADINITRGEFVTMLVRILVDGQKVPTVSMQFKDVSDRYFAKDDINYLAKLGIVKGYEDGTFKAGQPITRFEMDAIMKRYLDGYRKDEFKPNSLLQEQK